MITPTRLGGSDELCLRPPFKCARHITVDKLYIHPAAAAAFEAFRGVRVSATLPAPLADPLIAVRDPNGNALFFANFAVRFANISATSVSVMFAEGLDEEAIARIAWGEVVALAFGQLLPREGYRDLKRALKLVPFEISGPFLGSSTDAALARHLGVDVSRFRQGPK